MQVPLNGTDYFTSRSTLNTHDMSKMVNDLTFSTPLSCTGYARQQSCHLTEIEIIEGETNTTSSMQTKVNKEIMASEPNPEPALEASMLENLAVPQGALEDGTSFGIREDYTATFWLQDIEEHILSMMEAGNVDGSSIARKIRITEEESTTGGQLEEASMASARDIGEKGKPPNTILLEIPHGSGGMKKVNFCDTMPSSDKDQMKINVETCALPRDSNLVVAHKNLSEPSAEMNTFHADAASPRLQQLCKSLGHDKAVDTLTEKQRSRGDHKVVGTRQKLKKKNDSDLHTKQRKRSSTSISMKVCFT